MTTNKHSNPFTFGGWLGQTKWCENAEKNETLAHWYSSNSTQKELSDEYPHDRLQTVFKNVCGLVPMTKEH